MTTMGLNLTTMHTSVAHAPNISIYYDFQELFKVHKKGKTSIPQSMKHTVFWRKKAVIKSFMTGFRVLQQGGVEGLLGGLLGMRRQAATSWSKPLSWRKLVCQQSWKEKKKKKIQTYNEIPYQITNSLFWHQIYHHFLYGSHNDSVTNNRA